MNYRKTTILTAAAIATTMTFGTALAQTNTDEITPRQALQTRTQEQAEENEGAELEVDAVDTADRQNRVDRQQEQLNRRVGATEQREPMSPEQQRQADGDFVSWASDGHRYAIQSADVVIENSDNPTVVQVAELMKRDHEQALGLLEDAAQQVGAEVPDTIQYDVVEDSLENLREEAGGPEFEEKYVFESFGNAAESTLWYAKQAEQGQSPALQQYAANVIPLVQSHGQATQQVAAGLITGQSMDPMMQQQNARRPMQQGQPRQASDALGEVTPPSQTERQGQLNQGQMNRNGMERMPADPNAGLEEDLDPAVGTDSVGRDPAGVGAQVEVERPGN